MRILPKERAHFAQAGRRATARCSTRLIILRSRELAIFSMSRLALRAVPGENLRVVLVAEGARRLACPELCKASAEGIADEVPAMLRHGFRHGKLIPAASWSDLVRFVRKRDAVFACTVQRRGFESSYCSPQGFILYNLFLHETRH